MSLFDKGNARPKTALEILQEVLAKTERARAFGSLVEGQTLHLIEETRTFGSGRSLEGCILVEEADGVLRRITGAELSALAERYPIFLRKWRLERPDDGIV